MLSKQELINLLKKETDTTLKMMRAFPDEINEFKPHEKLRDVREVISTFLFEMYLVEAYLFGVSIERSKFTEYKPANVQSIIKDFEKETNEVIQGLEKSEETDLDKTVDFARHKFTAGEFVLMLIHDQIHHRGQLSVYVRLAGGKVPSVYGPSEHDSSTNF